MPRTFPFPCPENPAHVIESEEHAVKHAASHWPQADHEKHRQVRLGKAVNNAVFHVRRAALLGQPVPKEALRDAEAREEYERLKNLIPNA